MSYCRFSSDDFKCDVYCYESDCGFAVHVAQTRFDPPLPHCPLIGEASGEEWEKAHKAQMAAADVSRHVPIGLSRDGEDYLLATVAECAECLKSLKAEGYNVPQDAIDELLEDGA